MWLFPYLLRLLSLHSLVAAGFIALGYFPQLAKVPHSLAIVFAIQLVVALTSFFWLGEGRSHPALQDNFVFLLVIFGIPYFLGPLLAVKTILDGGNINPFELGLAAAVGQMTCWIIFVRATGLTDLFRLNWTERQMNLLEKKMQRRDVEEQEREAEELKRKENRARDGVESARKTAQKYYDSNKEYLDDLVPPELFQLSLDAAIHDELSPAQAAAAARDLIGKLQPAVQQFKERRLTQETTQKQHQQRMQTIRDQIADLKKQLTKLEKSGADPEIIEDESFAVRRRINDLEQQLSLLSSLTV